jgi:hypothetical protein
MPAHDAGCSRGQWLVRQPFDRGLFWVVLFQEGPACTCRLFSAEQSPERDARG